METLIAVVLLSSPVIFFVVMAKVGWGFRFKELFEDWKISKITALILFSSYLLIVIIFGHQDIGAHVSKGHKPFKDGWLEYYLFPGFLFSSIILPKIVGNKLESLGKLSYEAAEEVTIVFGWLFLIIWSTLLLSNWSYHL